MGLFDKTYQTSEEFCLDACYPNNYKKCLKFVQKTLKKGTPYPGDFTHEKLVVLEIELLTRIENTKDCAIKYAHLLEENIIHYMLRSLEKGNRKDDYLQMLPTAYIEKIYDNLCLFDGGVEHEKVVVCFVLAYLWTKARTLETVYDLPDGERGYEYFAMAMKYENKGAVQKIAPKIEKALQRVERIKGCK